MLSRASRYRRRSSLRRRVIRRPDVLFFLAFRDGSCVQPPNIVLPGIARLVRVRCATRVLLQSSSSPPPDSRRRKSESASRAIPFEYIVVVAVSARNLESLTRTSKRLVADTHDRLAPCNRVSELPFISANCLPPHFYQFLSCKFATLCWHLLASVYINVLQGREERGRRERNALRYSFVINHSSSSLPET